MCYVSALNYSKLPQIHAAVNGPYCQMLLEEIQISPSYFNAFLSYVSFPVQSLTVLQPSSPTSALSWWGSRLEERPTLPERSLVSSGGLASALKVRNESMVRYQWENHGGVFKQRDPIGLLVHQIEFKLLR